MNFVNLSVNSKLKFRFFINLQKSCKIFPKIRYFLQNFPKSLKILQVFRFIIHVACKCLRRLLKIFASFLQNFRNFSIGAYKQATYITYNTKFLVLLNHGISHILALGLLCTESTVPLLTNHQRHHFQANFCQFRPPNQAEFFEKRHKFSKIDGFSRYKRPMHDRQESNAYHKI